MNKVVLSGFFALLPLWAAWGQTFDKRQRLPAEINTKADELLPVFGPDGKTLYFTRSYSEANLGGLGGGQDIYTSTRSDDGTWQAAQALPKPLNNYQDNAVFKVAEGGKMIYLNNSYTKNPKIMAPGISYALNADGKWQKPKVIFLYGFNPENGYSGYCLGANENVLIISCPPAAVAKNRQPKVPGTASTKKQEYQPTGTAEDLYVSFKLDTGGYSVPVSMGGAVNSSGVEFAPWLDADGLTLYFASTGHKGLGSSDIFRSKRLDATYQNWSEPENLGPSVNTPGMDAYFSIAPDRRSALFASDSGGKGLCDLFSVVLPETLKQLKTADSLKAALLAQASVRQNEAVVQTDSGGLPYLAGVPKRSTDVITGYADTAFVKVLRDEIEALKAENNRLKNERRPGQKSEEEAVIEKRPEAERKQYTELLYRAYPKLTATYTVHFPFNKWDVKPGEEQTMTRLLEYLKLRPGANLFVYGHTDNVGTVEVNDQISALRGEAIKAWLERNGIESERIRSIGKGLFFPVAGNATAAGRKKNRRTDVEIREK